MSEERAPYEVNETPRRMKPVPDTPRGRRALLLRTERIKRGITQYEIASKLGITRGGYAMYERAETDPSFDDLPTIALALEIGVKRFFPEEDWIGGRGNNPTLSEIDQCLPLSVDQDALLQIARLLSDVPPAARQAILHRVIGYVEGQVAHMCPPETDDE